MLIIHFLIYRTKYNFCYQYSNNYENGVLNLIIILPIIVTNIFLSSQCIVTILLEIWKARATFLAAY